MKSTMKRSGVRFQLGIWMVALAAVSPAMPEAVCTETEPTRDVIESKAAVLQAEPALTVLDGTLSPYENEWQELLEDLVPPVKRNPTPHSWFTLSEASPARGTLRPFWSVFRRTEGILHRPEQRARDLQPAGEWWKAAVLPEELPGQRGLVLADTIATVRLLGGWSQRKDSAEPPEQFDLVWRDANGRLHYRWELLHERVGEYVRAGVKLFVVLDNVPYCFVENPVTSVYGQVMGPDEERMREYGAFIEALVRELVRAYGRKTVEQWDFCVGTEPDLFPGHWKDTPEKYAMMYDHVAAAVRSVLPKARVGPGNFVSPATRPMGPSEVILRHIAEGRNHVTGKTGSPIDFLAVSAYGIAKPEMAYPLTFLTPEVVRLDVWKLKHYQEKFPRLAGLPLEILEFGPHWVNADPDPENRATGMGPDAWGAAWTAHAYACALEEGVSRILTWTNYDLFEGTHLLTGGGWLRAQLAQMSGGEIRLLELSQSNGSNALLKGLAVVHGNRVQVLLSALQVDYRVEGTESIRLRISRELLPSPEAREIRIRQWRMDRQRSVHDTIRRDLVTAREHLRLPDYTYAIDKMASARGKALIAENLDRYLDMQIRGLTPAVQVLSLPQDEAPIILETHLPVPGVLILEIQ